MEHTPDAVRLAMIDYGSGWVAGAFRDVVRVVPWTFRFGAWAPRRGPLDGAQPLTRARDTNQGIVLAKRTFSGNGEFVWVWSVGKDGSELVHRPTGRTWDDDFAARPPEGPPQYLVRVSADSLSSTGLPASLSRMAATVSGVNRIQVRVDPAEHVIRILCPEESCSIHELDSGREVGNRLLPRGEVGTIPIYAEVRIEPVP